MLKNKSSILKRVLLMAILPLLLISAGCTPAPKPPKVTLKVWKPFVESDKMQKIITDFQKAYPNVKVEYTKKNIENYETDLLNALAAKEGPDIFSINNSWLPKYLDKIQPAPDKAITLKNYQETYVDALTQDFVKDSKIYGTAMWVDSLGLYYNKDLMGTSGIATPPKTWQELIQHVRRISQQDETGYFTVSGAALGTTSNINRASDIVYLLMLQAGAIPWSSDGASPVFANNVNRQGKSVKPASEAVEFYTSFANPASPNYNWNADSDYSIDAFVNGRAAYLYSYSYTRSQINAKSPNLNYSVAQVPQFSLSGTSVNYANYFGEVVSKQSQWNEWAWKFLLFATSKDALDSYYAKDKQPSSRRDLIEKQTSDLEIGVFANANLTAKTFYKPDEQKMDGIINEMIDNIILQNEKIDSAISEAQTKARRLSQESY